MIEETKKERERRFFYKFLDLRKDDVKIINDDTEKPDFIVNYNNCITGIEVTELLREIGENGSKIKRAESEMKKFVKILQRKYDDKYNDNIFVIFDLNLEYFKDRKVPENIVKEISSLIYDLKNGENEEYIFSSNNQTIKYSNIIRGLVIKENFNNNWSYVSPDVIYPSEKEVSKLIKKKNKKINCYLKHSEKPDKLWLLIVLSGEQISSTIDFEKFNKREVKETSMFEKTFFLNYKEDLVIEIQ
ncbi:MAG: hypothetical protein ACOCRX_05400 [Candidatus Woesearchaeota archaeon]